MKWLDRLKGIKCYDTNLNVIYKHKIHALNCRLEVKKKKIGILRLNNKTHTLYVHTLYGKYELHSLDLNSLWTWDYHYVDIFKRIIDGESDIECLISLRDYNNWIEEWEHKNKLK